VKNNIFKAIILTTMILLFIGCRPNKNKEVLFEIEQCKQLEIKSESDVERYNTQYNLVSKMISELDLNTDNSTDLANLRSQMAQLNDARSKKMIRFIHACIKEVSNRKDKLNAISALSAKITSNYAPYVLDTDKDQLNALTRELTSLKESAEMELRWAIWKNEIRSKLRAEIEREWEIHLSQKNPRFKLLELNVFEVDFTDNIIIDSPTEKRTSLRIQGKIVSTAETQGRISKWTNINSFENKYEFNITFDGNYTAKCIIGNDPYLEKVDLKFIELSSRKID
jgi:hypothetical protein